MFQVEIPKIQQLCFLLLMKTPCVAGSPTAQGRAATAATTKEADNTGIMAKYGDFMVSMGSS